MSKFHHALMAMENGKKCRRESWNRPAFVHIVPYPTGQCFEMVMRNGQRGPYTPSQCDMLESDWQEVPEPPAKFSEAELSDAPYIKPSEPRA